MSETSDDAGVESSPPFTSLKPAARVLRLLINVLMALCAVHVLTRIDFLRFMYAGNQPSGWSRTGVWLATLTDDCHVLIGIATLCILIVWLKKAQQNMKALGLDEILKDAGFVKNPYVMPHNIAAAPSAGFILSLPYSFVFNYEHVVIDLWRVAVTNGRWNDQQGRPIWMVPFAWWLLLVTLTIVHIIYYNLSAEYFGMQHRPGQMFVSAFAIFLFSMVIVIGWLSRIIINEISYGQERLAESEQARAEAAKGVLPHKSAGSVLKRFIGLFFIFASSTFAGYFIEAFAPKVFIPSAEQELRDQTAIKAQNLFFAGDHHALEFMIKELREQGPRTESGRQLQELFYEGYQGAMWAMARDPEWGIPQLQVRIENWRKDYPRSTAAVVAESILYFIISETGNSPHQRAQYLTDAQNFLQKNAWAAQQDAEWHHALMEAAKRKEDMKAFHQAATGTVQAFPEYFANYEFIVSTILRQPNSEQNLETFASWAATTARHDYIYTLSYWYAVRIKYDIDLFKETRADWVRIKKGLDELVAKYPGIWNRNIYARMACLAGDYQTTRERIDDIQGKAIRDLWWSKYDNYYGGSYGNCARWALADKPN